MRSQQPQQAAPSTLSAQLTSPIDGGRYRDGDLGRVQLEGEVQPRLLADGSRQLLRCSLAGTLHLSKGLSTQR